MTLAPIRPTTRRQVRPAIADPTTSNMSLHNTLTQVKEAVEIMQGQRGGNPLDSVVRWQDLVDLGLIAADQIPKVQLNK